MKAYLCFVSINTEETSEMLSLLVPSLTEMSPEDPQ